MPHSQHSTRTSQRKDDLISIRAAVLFAAAIGLLIGSFATERACAADSSFAPALLDVAQLPRIRPIARVGSFSSYDRTGGNDDGFSGKYSYLRKEGSDGYVIAEVFGAGALTRLWMVPANRTPIEFYFDGERKPRLVLTSEELFSGKISPFTAPLVGRGLGGNYSYVPLEFAKSVKVIARRQQSNFFFYQINYALYEPTVKVRTFRPSDSFSPPVVKTEGKAIKASHSLAPGQTIAIYETNKPGRIESLKLGPASALAAKDRAIVLRMFWDGAERPAVDVPVGDFFGYSFGEAAAQSLLLGTANDSSYVQFPMPFAKSARIELVSERGVGEPLLLQSEVTVSDRSKKADEAYFHARWRRENPTTDGEPFTFLDVAGRGHMVAAILQAQGAEPGRTVFFEGDDEATIDGKIAIRGTGSEDFFNGGWYEVPERWSQRGSLPYSGCLDYQRHLGRTGGYRLLIGDAYSFRRSLRHTIEHAPEKNNIPTDYVGTTFLYLDQMEGGPEPLVERALRSAEDPHTFVLSLAPFLPPIAFLMGASLDVEVVDLSGKRTSVAALSRRVLFPDILGPPGEPAGDTRNNFDTQWGPPRIAFSVDIPKAGVYAIDVEGITGPQQAMLQLRVNNAPLGDGVDFYAEEQGLVGPRRLAEVPLTEGMNELVLSIPGRNPKALGEGVQIISIKGTRLSGAEVPSAGSVESVRR